MKIHTPSKIVRINVNPWGDNTEEHIPKELLKDYKYINKGSGTGQIAGQLNKKEHNIVIVKAHNRSKGVLIPKEDKEAIDIISSYIPKHLRMTKNPY